MGKLSAGFAESVTGGGFAAKRPLGLLPPQNPCHLLQTPSAEIGGKHYHRPLRHVAGERGGAPWCHLASSSAQAAVNCGPHRLSGSSAENTCATAPFFDCSRRRDGIHCG